MKSFVVPYSLGLVFGVLAWVFQLYGFVLGGGETLLFACLGGFVGLQLAGRKWRSIVNGLEHYSKVGSVCNLLLLTIFLIVSGIVLGAFLAHLKIGVLYFNAPSFFLLGAVLGSLSNFLKR